MKDVDLTGIKLLQLRDDFDIQEVTHHFLPFIAERILAYTALNSLQYYPEISTNSVSLEHEIVTGHISQINKEAGLPPKLDFNKFVASVKSKFKNEFSNINDLANNVTLDWNLNCTFLTLTHLKDVLLVNLEDIEVSEFKSFYGRSVLRVLIQEYIKQYPDVFNRNFNVIDPYVEKGNIKDAAEEHLKHMGVPKLTEEETLDHLKSLKCLRTGLTGKDILTKDFTILRK